MKTTKQKVTHTPTPWHHDKIDPKPVPQKKYGAGHTNYHNGCMAGL